MTKQTADTAEKYQFMEGLKEISGTNIWAAASVKPMLITSMEVIRILEANAPVTEA